MAGKAAPTRPTRDRRRRAAFIGGIAVLVVGIVGLVRYTVMRRAAAPSGAQAAAAAAAGPSASAPSAAADTSASGGPVVKKERSAKTSHAGSAAHSAQASRPEEKPKSVTAVKAASTHENPPAGNMLIVANGTGPAPAKAPEIPPTASDVANHSTQPQAPVTITGCLETTVDESEFRLTDTEGASAPKARSWKSAFIKKSATPVSLVGYSDPAGLKKLVGHRVAATGTLTSGELHLRSYKPAGASCSN
jgi:hypothetical protein